MKSWRAMAVGVVMLACAAPAMAEPLGPAQVWLIPAWSETSEVRSSVSVLNLSATQASVSCTVFTETGARADRASQTKTYAPGASRSNEGGSLPCGFLFAGASSGWAVLVSSVPVIVRASSCVRSVCTPIEATPLDCSTPAGLETACALAPRAFIIPREVLQERPVIRPR